MASNDSNAAVLNSSELTEINNTKQESVGGDPIALLNDVEEPIAEDSQTSDALDSQTELECGATTTSAVVPKKKTVIIEVDHLEKLLDAIVAKTEEWTLEKLLRFYSKLSKLVDRYLKLWDRRSLIEVTAPNVKD